MSRGVFFRTLFRGLLDVLRGAECLRLAQVFGGYDFADLGNIVWTPEAAHSSGS
jgi:putative molybdopterin biosynthesis protein